MEELVDRKVVAEPKLAITEAALLLVLEKLFKVVLNLPSVNRYIRIASKKLCYRYLVCFIEQQPIHW